MTDMHSGSCLCGSVRFSVEGPVSGVRFCHCSQCRKQSGHFFAAADASDAALTIDGADRLTWYRASDFAGRGFCAICGSTLFWKRDGSSRTSILAGAFDTPSRLSAESHIFIADKGDYYEIGDGLPRHAGPG